MSLHRIVHHHISNRSIIAGMLLCVFAGISLPFLGVQPPPLMVVAPGEINIADYSSKVSEEIKLLTKQKSREGISALEYERIRRQLDEANTKLVATLFRERQSTKGVVIQPPTSIRPPIPDFGFKLEYGVQSLVPRQFISRLPDLSGLTVQKRKLVFTQIMLPLILYENERIEQQHKEMAQAYAENDLQTLAEYAGIYKLKADESWDADRYFSALDVRIRPVPIGLALTQAAVESGWGGSRFALEGNALFGQWVFNDQYGIQAAGSSVTVRRFPDLMSSVRSYMRNLNTHRAYREFRKMRFNLLQSGKPLIAAPVLVTLKAYAEDGNAYVKTLRSVLKTNRFDLFVNAQLGG